MSKISPIPNEWWRKAEKEKEKKPDKGYPPRTHHACLISTYTVHTEQDTDVYPVSLFYPLIDHLN